MIASIYTQTGRRQLWQTLWLSGALLVAGTAAGPAHGESFEYYVWTDDDNVVHMADQPPAKQHYETRTVDTDHNIIVGAKIRSSNDDIESSGSSSRSSTTATRTSARSTPRLPGQSISGIGRAVLLEASRREQVGVDTGPRSILPPNGASPTDSNLPRSILIVSK